MSKQFHEFKKLRAIKYTHATNKNGEHLVRFYDDYGDRREYKNLVDTSNVNEQTQDFGVRALQESGFNIVAVACDKDCYIALVDNWGDGHRSEYKKVKDIKQI